MLRAGDESCRNLPIPAFCDEILIIIVSEELVKLSLIRYVRAFHLAIQAWSTRPNIGVAHAEIFDMPMEFGLKLVPIIGSNGMNAKRKPFDDVVDK